MRQRSSQLTHRGNTRHTRQLFALIAQVCLCLSALRDIDRRTDIAEKSTVRFEARHGGVENPAILTVMPAQTVFHGKLLAGVECSIVLFQEAVRVLGVKPRDPAVVEFLIECASSEIQPGSIKKCEALVCA